MIKELCCLAIRYWSICGIGSEYDVRFAPTPVTYLQKQIMFYFSGGLDRHKL